MTDQEKLQKFIKWLAQIAEQEVTDDEVDSEVDRWLYPERSMTEDSLFISFPPVKTTETCDIINRILDSIEEGKKAVLDDRGWIIAEDEAELVKLKLSHPPFEHRVYKRKDIELIFKALRMYLCKHSGDTNKSWEAFSGVYRKIHEGVSVRRILNQVPEYNYGPVVTSFDFHEHSIGPDIA